MNPRPLSILQIEDRQGLCERRSYYTVAHVQNVQAAQEILLKPPSDSFPFHCVLMDISMEEAEIGLDLEWQSNLQPYGPILALPFLAGFGTIRTFEPYSASWPAVRTNGYLAVAMAMVYGTMQFEACSVRDALTKMLANGADCGVAGEALTRAVKGLRQEIIIGAQEGVLDLFDIATTRARLETLWASPKPVPIPFADDEGLLAVTLRRDGTWDTIQLASLFLDCLETYPTQLAQDKTEHQEHYNEIRAALVKWEEHSFALGPFEKAVQLLKSAQESNIKQSGVSQRVKRLAILFAWIGAHKNHPSSAPREQEYVHTALGLDTTANASMYYTRVCHDSGLARKPLQLKQCKAGRCAVTHRWELTVSEKFACQRYALDKFNWQDGALQPWPTWIRVSSAEYLNEARRRAQNLFTGARHNAATWCGSEPELAPPLASVKKAVVGMFRDRASAQTSKPQSDERPFIAKSVTVMNLVHVSLVHGILGWNGGAASGLEQYAINIGDLPGQGEQDRIIRFLDGVKKLRDAVESRPAHQIARTGVYLQQEKGGAWFVITIAFAGGNANGLKAAFAAKSAGNGDLTSAVRQIRGSVGPKKLRIRRDRKDTCKYFLWFRAAEIC